MNRTDAQRIPAPRGSRSRARSTSVEWLGRVLLVVGAVAVTLGLVELGMRAAYGALGSWPNYVRMARAALDRSESQRFVPDAQLGHVPRAGSRSNGVTGAVTDGPVVLALGDSYTWGDEVGDDETWPAFLQATLSRPVVNGGVSGYGFDQIVLRAEAMAPTVKPGTIVVAFIADDIRRTEMSRLWGAEKPWFAIDDGKQGDGKLVLRNVPVPRRPAPETTLTAWQEIAGYSLTYDFLMRRLGLLEDWFGDHVRANAAGSGERIACLLTGRLAALQKSSGAKVLMVALYDPVTWRAERFTAEQRRLTAGLLECARRQGLATLDTFDDLNAVMKQGTTPKDGVQALFGRWHMTADGNSLVARTLARTLGPSLGADGR